MIVVTGILVGLLAAAVAAAMGAYRYAGSAAWTAEFDHEGGGLGIEVALLCVVALVGVAISIIMRGSFTTLFLDGGWHSNLYLALVGVVALGVAAYMIVFAPRILARKQGVDDHCRRRECLVPYLLYSPFSIILWVGLVLPVIALMVISFHGDHRRMIDARTGLARSGAIVEVLAKKHPETATEHVALYNLEYKEAVGTVRGTVNRYLWVIGVFLFFLIVILNTRITAAYTDAAQDAFKWMMWILLGLALAVVLYGLTQYHEIRDVAAATDNRVVSIGVGDGQLRSVIAAKRALLELNDSGASEVLRGGFIGLILLLISTNLLQFVMARVTHRSASDLILPRSVARFFRHFLIMEDKSAGHA